MIDASKLLDLVLNGTGGGTGLQGTGSVPATRPGYDTPAHDAPRYNTRGSETGAESASQPNDLIEQAKGFLRGQGGGIVGGAAAGALTTLLLGTKSGREIAGDALKLGTAAALGGLAYKAYTNYRDGKPLIGTRAADYIKAAQSGATLPGAPPENEHAMLLLRAMIAAALSDGLIDADERQRIVGRLSDIGISVEEQTFLDRQIAMPWSPQQFAAAATTPEIRSEIYLASSIAIEADTPAEKAYLRYLAATLGLEDGLVAHLDAAVQSAKGTTTSVPQVRAAGG
jgi:uncharacterized membrane protein YebE (DUF533 family)